MYVRKLWKSIKSKRINSTSLIISDRDFINHVKEYIKKASDIDKLMCILGFENSDLNDCIDELDFSTCALRELYRDNRELFDNMCDMGSEGDVDALKEAINLLQRSKENFDDLKSLSEECVLIATDLQSRYKSELAFFNKNGVSLNSLENIK